LQIRGDDGAWAIGAIDGAAAAAPAGERSQLRGHRQQIGKSAALTVGALALARAALRTERSSEFGRFIQFLCPHARARGRATRSSRLGGAAAAGRANALEKRKKQGDC